MEEKKVVNYDEIFSSIFEFEDFLSENYFDQAFWKELEERLKAGDKTTIALVVRFLKNIAPELKILKQLNRFYADYFYCPCGWGIQGNCYYIP